MKKLYILIPIILLTHNLVFAQKDSNTISDIIDAFKQLKYEIARQQAEDVLENWQKYNPDELLEIHKILGVIYFIERDKHKSKIQFEQALSINSSFELDPIYISPKIVTFFDEIKTNFQKQSLDSRETIIRYVFIPDPRPKAILRSTIVPGWGQVYKGDKLKGKFLMIASGINLASLITAITLREQAKDEYLDATMEIDIANKYDTYNKFHKASYYCAYTFGILWLYSMLDTIISEPLTKKSITIYPHISTQKLCLNFRLSL